MLTFDNPKKLEKLYVQYQQEARRCPKKLAKARAKCSKIVRRGKWVICYQGTALELRTVFTIKNNRLSYVQTAGAVDKNNKVWDVFAWNANLRKGKVLKGATVYEKQH